MVAKDPAKDEFATKTNRPMTPRQLRARLHDLEAEPPVTVAFERELAANTDSLRKIWYRHQKEHWLGWLREYNGPGYYGRKNWKVSAETVYKRINNPAMVLWLGEAVGVPEQ
ncbi:MAG: hypothetical protein R3D44_17705 [Hyphomicrobiaceae bacterium]